MTQKQTSRALPAADGPQLRRRTSKCEECPYKDAKPSRRTVDELAYARCTPPEDFHCHMEGSYGYGDGKTMCRGHWEMFHAAEKRGIAADESAGDRVFENFDELQITNATVEPSGPTKTPNS